MVGTEKNKSDSSKSIRVSIPASVANDIDLFKKSVGALAEELGCITCFSGVDCRFEMERDFLVNANLTVERGNTEVSKLSKSPSEIRVSMPVETSHNLKSILAVVDNVGATLGSHGAGRMCCSGFDLSFRQELDFIADIDGNIRNRT